MPTLDMVSKAYPRYLRVAQLFGEQIAPSKWKPGDCLPSFKQKCGLKSWGSGYPGRHQMLHHGNCHEQDELLHYDYRERYDQVKADSDALRLSTRRDDGKSS